MSKTIKADLCIIGAGSAGLSVAAGAAQLGRKVVLLEKGKMGGDCLNYGCVPSKALIAAANAAHHARTSAKFGIKADPVVDFPKVMDHVESVIAAIEPHDSQERFEGLGVTVIREHGRFTGPRTIAAGDKTISAKHFLIATGSSPFIPPIDGLAQSPYLTNETIFANRQLPDHLIVIGGGPIGVELAQAHCRLGSSVSIIEASTILNRDDPDAVSVVRASLLADGIDLKENQSAAHVDHDGHGFTVRLTNGEEVRGSHLLVAVGRRTNTDDLGLEQAGVATDKRGIIANDRLQTDNKRIYCAGDVAGGLQFTHVAGDHASTIVRNVLFKMPAKRRDDIAPKVTYCDPEVASVGLSEQEAQSKDKSAKTVTWPFKDNDRAQTEANTNGFIKVVTRKNGDILGATIVGKGAGNEIGLWAYALANGHNIKAMTNYIAPYPTRGEVSKRAGGAYYTPSLFSARARLLVRLLSTFD
ncbi:MAG: FAD-dependent oxidoreductase [Pseudomonadota bacterium]